MEVTFKNIIENGLWGIRVSNEGITGMAFMTELLVVCLLCAAEGYLFGSLSPAVIISRRLFGRDIRESGSGNAGMTNMFRVYGKKGGLLTLLGDTLKTVLSTAVGYLIFGYVGAWLSGLFCVLGHVFPVFYGFRGGKGVLVAAVLLLLTDWPVFLTAIFIFAGVLVLSEMVSLASVMAALTMPLFLRGLYAVVYGEGSVAGIRLPIAIVIAAVVVLKHIPNIKRIRSGTENKVTMPWNKKKKKAGDPGAQAPEEPGAEGGPERNAAPRRSPGTPDPNTSIKKQKRRKK
jgi:glycerol-3-phosphate acyltransferase PlsY